MAGPVVECEESEVIPKRHQCALGVHVATTRKGLAPDRDDRSEAPPGGTGPPPQAGGRVNSGAHEGQSGDPIVPCHQERLRKLPSAPTAAPPTSSPTARPHLAWLASTCSRTPSSASSWR